MDVKAAEERIKYLSDTLKYHNKKYYIDDAPEIENWKTHIRNLSVRIRLP